MTDVFISYSRKDTDFVRRLHEALAARNRDSWVDWEDIPVTADWWREIQGGIEAADAFVFVISPDSLRSEVCRREIDHAVASGKRVIPVLRRPPEGDQSASMHPVVSSHNWLFFRETDDFDAAFQQLINALDTDLSYVRQHTRLLVRAREWDNNGRDSSLQLRGDDLKRAEEWLAQGVAKKPAPTPLHAEYLAASRQAAVARQRSLLIGVSAALVISIGLSILSLLLFGEANRQRDIADANAATAVFAQGEAQNQAQIAQTQAAIATIAQGEAEIQRNEAQIQATAVARERDRARSIALAGQAQVELNGPRPERAALLALEALQNNAYTWQAERALGLAVRGQLNQMTLSGHQDAVYSVAWSPDGKRLVTASADGMARIWDGISGALLFTLAGHRGDVNRALWSPDGKHIATASADNTAIIWDASTGAVRHTLRGHTGAVYLAVWSPDGTRLATASADNTARIWDPSSGDPLFTLSGHTESVFSLDWSPDSARLVTASADNSARIWDATNGQLLVTLSGHSQDINRAVWSSDGQRLVTASADRTAAIWDASTGQRLFTLAGHILSVRRALWSPDGKRIATASADRTARIWDTETGTLLFTLFGHTSDVIGVTWSPGGKRIVTVGADNTARVWDSDSGAQLLVLTGHANTVYSVDWASEGGRIATGSQDGTAIIWQVWSTARSLINFAHQCCTPRQLTDEERSQFGLPLLPAATPPAQIATCPNALASRLYPGARGEVSDETDAASNVRNGPGLTRGIIAQISPLQTFRVIAGPECADGYAWFQVLFGINAVQGWVAESGDGIYYVRPVE